MNSDGVYVFFKRCGCWVGAVSNLLDDPKWVARECADFLKSGYRMEHLSDEQWRNYTGTGAHKCPHGPKQPKQEALFA